jgi:SNF2 family DNA or RNA helicase
MAVRLCLTNLNLSDNQAFGRVFRIGQDKQTHFVKMVVEDTVDARLLLTRKSNF